MVETSATSTLTQEWLRSLIKPLKVAETVSRNVRLLVYAYLDTKDIIYTIGRLNRKERQRMIESFLANSQREWHINLDSFNPMDAAKNRGLFSRL